MKKPTSQLLRLALPTLPIALAAPFATGAVIYTNPADLTIVTDGTTTGTGTIYFDLGTDGGTGSASTDDFDDADFQLSFNSILSGPQADKPSITQSAASDGVAEETVSSSTYATNVASGATIDASSDSFSTSSTPSILLNSNGGNDANWAAGTTGYVGLEFDAGSGGTNYGWAQISYNSDESITLHDFAYESTSGVAITAGAGAIPEPATDGILAGLLAGSAALFACRRKRTSAA